MPSLDPCEIYLSSILEVAVQSAVLSIRQRGDLQYLTLVNRIIHLGKPHCMYDGTDMASIALIGHLPGTLDHGLTIYKRGVVNACKCVDTSGSDMLCSNVWNVMATSTILSELGGRFGGAMPTLLSRDLLATMDSDNRFTAEAFYQLFRANSLLALIYRLSRCNSEAFLMDLLLDILQPVVISVWDQITQPRSILRTRQITASSSKSITIALSADKHALQEHIPALCLLSPPEGVTSYTLCRIPTRSLTTLPPFTKASKASSTRGPFPITQADARVLGSVKVEAVLGKRTRSDEYEGIPAPKCVGRMDADAMKENIDPACVPSGAR